MARQGSLIILSLLVHGGLAVALGTVRPEQSRAATAIEIAEVKKPKAAPPPPARVDPEPPPPVQKQRALKRAAPKPAAAAPPPSPVPQAQAPVDVPDFGLTLSGAVNGTGIALPGGSPGGKPQAPRATARRPAPVAANALPKDGCSEPATKPKPRSVPQPSYPDSARAAGVEGKVRVELTVDEQGSVVSVRLLSGLGHGLDEAALAAARHASFEPALRCGKPARATFTISMRFSAS